MLGRAGFRYDARAQYSQHVNCVRQLSSVLCCRDRARVSGSTTAGRHLINKRKGCLSRQQTGMTSAKRESNSRPGVEILDGMLTNSTHGLCEAVLGEVWCPCISYSATSKTRLEILPAVAPMCICGHDYSWHGARRAGQLEYSTRSRQPVHSEPETGHPVPLIPAQGK